MELMSILLDCNYKESEKMANITNYLNKIKTAVYGKDVRGAIHDAIKQVYDDASVNHDNANMEVKMARGTHNTLNDRLDNVDEIQAQTNAQLSSHLNSSFRLYSANLSQNDEHGSFTLFKFPNNFNLLVDVGYTGQEAAIQAFLASKEVNHLDVVIVTHFDADHSGCFEFIAENYCNSSTLFYRGMTCDWSQFTADTTENQQQEITYHSTLRKLGYEQNSRIPNQNEIVTFNNGEVKCRFLNSDSSFSQSYYLAKSDSNQTNYIYSTLNNFALMVEVTAYGKSVLMCGDVEQQAQINNAPFIKKCDVMQVPHHNWNHNGYYKFFDNISPELAFYNRNLVLNDEFVYWSKYQRQSGKIVPTYYTYGNHVEINCSSHGVQLVQGTRDENIYISGDKYQFVEHIPYYTDTKHNYWEYASWTIKDVLSMIKELPNDVSVPLFPTSRYSKFLSELKAVTGLDTNVIVSLNSRGFNVKRASNWDGKVYHFEQYFNFEQPSSYTANYYETRTSFTNNSENTNMNLSVGNSKALDHEIRNPQKLVVNIKSTHDNKISTYTIPIVQQVDSTTRYLANDVNVSIDGENRYLRIIKCSLIILDQIVTLEECKLYVYNLLNNTLQEYECTLDSLKGDS